MLKKIILSLLLTLFVYANEYEDVVQNFLSYQNIQKGIENFEFLKKDDVNVGYLFNLKGGGYVVVPLSTQASPIKAYSFENNFTQLPPPYKEFLINELYSFLITNKTLAKTIDTKILDRWDFLKNFTTTTRVLKKYIPNSYLLTSLWNQTAPYNKFYPKVGSDTTIAGCVQIAMGQVMKYHKYPNRAKGVFHHNAAIYGSNNAKVRDEELTAVLNRDYNWEIMPNTFDDTTQEYQEDEVGYFLRDLVVVNRASPVGVSLTSASANTEALVENFAYSTDIKRASTSTIARGEFITIAKSQIDKELPFLFSIPGHMVVVDGYKDDLTGNYLHLNMGWGGSANDFYNIDETVIAGGHNYDTTNLSMIYDIKPCSEVNNDCYKNLEINDVVTANGMEGVFDKDNDSDKYQKYLKGNVTIGGTRGYSNQSFYINIYDSNNSLISSSDSEVSLNLPADLYVIDISLTDPSGYHYYYDASYSSYTVSIVSDILTANEISQVNNSLDRAPKIDMNLKDIIITKDRKILINSYDENEDDNITLTALGNSSVDLSFANNILTIHPKVAKGFSPITINASSNGKTVSKEFMLIINNEETYFGKEFTVNGNFNSVTEFEKHKVILDGSCTVKGYNGHSNQSFFTSVMDINNNYLINMADTEISTSNLSQDFYLLGASLKQNPDSAYGSYYNYDENFSNYTLTVNCPDADENITKIASLLNIDISFSASADTDSDNDGMPDEWEIANGFNVSVDDSLVDSDNDGKTNLQEYLDETNPNDANSKIFTIELNQGWNLISLPALGNVNISDLNNSDIKIVRSLQNDVWYLWTDSNQSSTELPLTNFEDGYGYWVNTTQNTVIDFKGQGASQPHGFSSLNHKWKMLGSVDIPDMAIFFDQNPNITIVWKYKNNQWYSTSKESAINDTLSEDNNISELISVEVSDGFMVKSDGL